MRPSAMAGRRHTPASKGNAKKIEKLHTQSQQTMAGTRRRNSPPRKLITVDREPTTTKPQHFPTDRHHTTEIQHQGGGCLTSPPVQPNQPTCSNNSLTNPNPQLISMPTDFIHRHACRDTMHNQRPSAYRLRPQTPVGGTRPPLVPFLGPVGTNVACVTTKA